MSKNQWFTYSDLGKRMKVKPETARRASDRAKLEKRKGNHGKQEVLIDLNDPRFDGSLSRRQTKVSASSPVLKSDTQALVLRLEKELSDTKSELQKSETALKVSEAIRHEKEAQINSLKDHIDTLKNQSPRRWFWFN